MFGSLPTIHTCTSSQSSTKSAKAAPYPLACAGSCGNDCDGDASSRTITETPTDVASSRHDPEACPEVPMYCRSVIQPLSQPGDASVMNPSASMSCIPLRYAL